MMQRLSLRERSRLANTHFTFLPRAFKEALDRKSESGLPFSHEPLKLPLHDPGLERLSRAIEGVRALLAPLGLRRD